MIGVAWTGSEGEFQDFIDRHELTFPQLSDAAGVVYERFGIPYQPAFVAIAPDGTAAALFGAADDAAMEQLIDAARG